MTETNLKTCPFCGGKAKCVEFYELYHVVCCDCYVAGQDCLTREDAVSAWNTRQVEKKMKSDNVKLMMTNKLLKKRVKRLEEALEVILEATKDEKPCITAINVVAYMALKEKNND